VILIPAVSVAPTRVPAGDPTITVKAGPDAKQVYAVLPDGRKLYLKETETGVWKVSFLVPFGTPDGPYNIQVYVVGAGGEVWQSNYGITIDNSLPLMKIKELAQEDGTYRLEIQPLFNAVSMKYSVPGHGDTEFTRNRGSAWWTAVVPAGEGTVIAIDESGYEVIQPMSLAIVKPAVEPVETQAQAVPAIGEAVRELAATRNGKGAANGNYGPYAVIAALMVVAGVLFARRIKLRTK